ncbi:hypothetical protein AMECASPLE_027463 [Ameca splendens]|uniref:Uncharacterized protein n=1 Tax=Ameca splendens TaxID=208324 RepID=A0ABV1A0R2_9TELE
MGYVALSETTGGEAGHHVAIGTIQDLKTLPEVSCWKQFAEKSSNHNRPCLVGPAHLSLISFTGFDPLRFRKIVQTNSCCRNIAAITSNAPFHHINAVGFYLNSLSFITQ